MANYRCSLKDVLSRSKGGRVARTAAYILRDRVQDERSGETYDYSRHRDKTLFTGIYLPSNAPEWARDIESLVNAIERSENRKDSQLIQPMELSLAHEFTLKQNRWMMQDFIKENATRKGYAVIAAIHAPPKGGDERNIHAHLLISLRKIDEHGFAETKKEQQDSYMKRSERTEALRQSWEKHLKHHLERHGFKKEAEEVSCKSLEDQGIDREAGVHIGPNASQMEKRGEKTELGDKNREIEARNRQREELKAEHGKVAREINAAEKQLEAERQRDRDQRTKKETAAKVAQAKEEGRSDARREEAAPFKNAAHQATRAGDKALRVATGAADVTLKLADCACELLDCLVGSPAPKKYTAAELARDPAARRAYNAQMEAERGARARRAGALEEIKKDIEANRDLNRHHMRHLNPADLQSIKDKGDAGLLEIIRDFEAERAKDSWHGQQRERDRGR